MAVLLHVAVAEIAPHFRAVLVLFIELSVSLNGSFFVSELLGDCSQGQEELE